MSTGPRAKAQENQSTMEQQASLSTLLFFVQEVSKLASPVQNSSPSTWLKETSFSSLKKEEEEESHSREVRALIDPRSELCSPWKVMNLIDHQCERLQQRRCDGEESEPASDSHSADIADQDYTGECVSIKCSVSPFPLINETEDIAARCLPAGDVSHSGEGECCLQLLSSSMGCCVHSQSGEKSHKAGAEPVKEEEEEEELSVDGLFGWTQEPEERSSSEQDALKEPVSTNTSSTVSISHLSPDEPLTLPLHEDKSPALTLDHNANLVLATEVPLSPLSLLFSCTEKCYSLLRQGDSPKAECRRGTQEYSGCTGDAKPSAPSASKAGPWPEQQEEVAPPLRRNKRHRKQPHPSRSADIQDPDFQGVTFRIDTELDDSREQCRLHITSKYSMELCKRLKKPRARTRLPYKSLKSSSSEEESDPMTGVSKDKVCRSCGTRKTPMWRDAEDGTPLCNACGIRYKKYRVRCVYCWHIPRKDSTSNSHCLKCGNFVRLTSAQRKPSI